ncbi:MAG TPA: protein kinase [Thermoanaerobaculia bacterium]
MTVLSPEIEATYEILDTMGGGMGAVYKVRHRLFGEIRIIKVMQAALKDDSSLRDRFSAEAKRGKQLKHRNIAEVLDFLIGSDGNAYLVMEYIGGVNLRDAFARTEQPLDPRTVIEIGEQTLAGLGYLHSRNLVHRDISPENLMVTKDETGCLLVKLIDLGIAKSLEDTITLTRAGDFMGKLSYASPEQFGEKIDSRSDFYSLGIVLYELLTRFKPITATNTGAFVLAHCQTPPRPFSETDPTGQIPQTLRGVVLKALEKKPENRYQTAGEFAAALHATLTADLPPAMPASAGLPPLPAAAVPLSPTTPSRTLPATLPQTEPWIVPPVPSSTAQTGPPGGRISRRLIAIQAAVVLIGVIAIAVFEWPRYKRTTSVASPQSTAGVTTSTGTTAGGTIVVPAPQLRPVTPTPNNEVEPPTVEPSAAIPAVVPSTTPQTSSEKPRVPDTHTAEPSGTAAIAPSPSPGPFTPDLAEGDRQRGKALAFSNAHQWQDAVNAWQQFIRDYSGVKPAADHAAYYNLGVAYESLQNWREAAEAFERATFTSNGSSDTANLLHLGRCYGKLGRWNDAAAAYERVLRVDPQNEIAKRNLPLALQQAPRGQ